MPANVLALGEEADFKALNCLPVLNLIRNTKLHLRTEPFFYQTPVSGSLLFHINFMNLLLTT